MKMITASLILIYQWPCHVWRTAVQQQCQAIAKVLESSSSFLISFSSTPESWARYVCGLHGTRSQLLPENTTLGWMLRWGEPSQIPVFLFSRLTNPSASVCLITQTKPLTESLSVTWDSCLRDGVQ